MHRDRQQIWPDGLDGQHAGQPYCDLGADCFNQLDAERIQQHHVKRLQQLGYDVILTPRAAALERGTQRVLGGR